MTGPLDWVSSFGYGGDFSVAANNQIDDPTNNVDTILSELRSVGEVEHTFRVVQIGRAMLRKSSPSLANLQLVLRDFYFNYRRYGSPAMSVEHLVTVSSHGLLFSARDASGEVEKINSVRFGPDSVVQATAMKFVTSSEKKNFRQKQTKIQQSVKKSKIGRAQQAVLAAMLSLASRYRSRAATVTGRFTSIDKPIFSLAGETEPLLEKSPDGIQQSSEPPWFLIQPEYQFLSQVYHPPIIAFILRRHHRVRSVDLHVFVCCSDSDAVQLVTLVTVLRESVAYVTRGMTPASVVESPVYGDALSLGLMNKKSNKKCQIYANNDGSLRSDSSAVEDDSYYEQLAVKEQFITGGLKKNPKLARKNHLEAKRRLPFVNPNVVLSEDGTLESRSPAIRCGILISKLATPIASADVVDTVSKPITTLLAEVKSQPTTETVVRATPVQIEVKDNDQGKDNENAVETSNPPRLAGELLPVPEVQMAIRSQKFLKKNWPKSLQQTSPTSEMLNQKKAAATFGDVQTLLGYIP